MRRIHNLTRNPAPLLGAALLFVVVACGVALLHAFTGATAGGSPVPLAILA
ncbi:MAG TPA: hypothetical protein VFV17_01290 [Usitatibacteraceae bacterium]|nr:hypothetical protein [Usitatibacteraceae bacterium]